MDRELEEKIKKEIPSEDSTSHEEKMILFNAICEHKPCNVVEIGTHRGLTTLYMAAALEQNKKGHLWTADPFEWGQKGNFRKFPELEKRITYRQIPGKELAVSDIDFLFIDGFHEKEAVLDEIDALFPYLREGAQVYFHDTNGRNEYCDVPGAIEERGLKVEYLKTTNGMAHYVYYSKPVNKTSVSKTNPRKSRKTK